MVAVASTAIDHHICCGILWHGEKNHGKNTIGWIQTLPLPLRGVFFTLTKNDASLQLWDVPIFPNVSGYTFGESKKLIHQNKSPHFPGDVERTGPSNHHARSLGPGNPKLKIMASPRILCDAWSYIIKFSSIELIVLMNGFTSVFISSYTVQICREFLPGAARLIHPVSHLFYPRQDIIHGQNDSLVLQPGIWVTLWNPSCTSWKWMFLFVVWFLQFATHVQMKRTIRNNITIFSKSPPSPL